MTVFLNSYVELPGASNHYDYQFPWNETDIYSKSSPTNRKNNQVVKSPGEDFHAAATARLPLDPARKSKDSSEEVQQSGNHSKLQPKKLVNRSVLKKSLKHVTGFVKQKIVSLEELVYSNTIVENTNLTVELENKGDHISSSKMLEDLSKNFKSNQTTKGPSNLSHANPPTLTKVFGEEDQSSSRKKQEEKVSVENKTPLRGSKNHGSTQLDSVHKAPKLTQNSRSEYKSSRRKERNSSGITSNAKNTTRPSSSPKSLERKGNSAAEPTVNELPMHADENLLSILKRFKTIFLLDDSSSMADGEKWKEANEVFLGLAGVVAEYDKDGIELQFLHSNEHFRNMKDVSSIIQNFNLIQPIGDSTPTENKVEEIIEPYIEKLGTLKSKNRPLPKPLNLIIITDGITDDLDSFITIIGNFSSKLDAGHFPLNQIGIQIVQIGIDRRVTRILKYLDNDLQAGYGVSRDIIDTTHFTGKLEKKFIMKCLLGGINRRVDRMELSS